MYVPGPITPEQLEALALTSYINDLSRRLEHHDYHDLENDNIPRPLSPPPEYDRYGKRTNTREQRIVKELETERTLAVYYALETIPNYSPPANFTKLTRSTEKFYLPVRSHPHINFIGLLLGPRGNNLRYMESESGAKISIRGRGSVKEGSRAAAQPGNEEDLHCAVTAISVVSIKRAFELIQNVVDTAIETPEHQNDFKRLQLRQLAVLNGTLRDYENQLCSHCHQPGHRKVNCPQRQALMNESECRSCNQKGHFMKHCPNSQSEQMKEVDSQSRDQISSAETFLKEIEDADFDDNTTKNNIAASTNKLTDTVQSIENSSGSGNTKESSIESDDRNDKISSEGNDNGSQKDVPPPQAVVDSVLAPPGLEGAAEENTLPLPPPSFVLPPPPVAWKPPHQ